VGLSPGSRKFAQWEIWTVPWTDENGETKDRPALLISPDQYINENDMVRFMMISTQEVWDPYRVDLLPGDSGWFESGLDEHSYFYIREIRKIPKSEIKKWIGYVTLTLGAKIDEAIRATRLQGP